MNGLSDTDPKIQRILDEMWRKTPPGEKILNLFSMIEAARNFAEIGIKRRHPGATESEIRKLAAEHFLGKNMAKKVLIRLEAGS